MKWKNIAAETTIYFITATITEWQPLLNRPEAAAIILNDFEFYRRKYKSKILAYVIMPEHYHLIVQFEQAGHLHGWLHDVQLHTSRELSKLLKQTSGPDELAVYAKHANGPAHLAVWKEQARAVGLTSRAALMTKIDYVHKNPVTRKLVDNPGEWTWSSWRNYYLDDDSVFRVDRVDIL